MRPRVGVLALQGNVREHLKRLEGCGVIPVVVKESETLNTCDGLVLPGGESTTMVKLLQKHGLFEPLKRYAETHPILGTCAGAILLSKRIESLQQPSLGVLDITIARNAFGRQTESFTTDIKTPEALKPYTQNPTFPAVFIRGPVITSVGSGVTVLAQLESGGIVAVEEGNKIALSFHPEMTEDPLWHQYFCAKIRYAV